jgi:hypothetical protein
VCVGVVDAVGAGSSGGVRVRRAELMVASVPSQSSDALTPGGVYKQQAGHVQRAY